MDEDVLNDLTGKKFLEHIAKRELQCAEASMRELPNLGKKAPECYETLGMALCFLDCVGTCYWGCAREDHRLEYLMARATNSGYAAVLLATRGYYDQALSLARTLGEIANLVTLFYVDRAKIDEWKNADEKTRRSTFDPVKVRLAVEKCGLPIPIDQDRYKRLSVASIHSIPDAVPQGHNPRLQGITTPVFQPSGFLLALNEVALPIGFILHFCPDLFPLKAEIRSTCREISDVLLEAVGNVLITVEGKPWFKLN